jgi:crossover junction endodeoxyribonuclease RuvC
MRRTPRQRCSRPPRTASVFPFFLSPLRLQSHPMAADVPCHIRLIGVDPGLNLTGYGLIEVQRGQISLCEAGVIRLPRSRSGNLAERLNSLFNELNGLLEDFRPQKMCLEDVYSHRLYPHTAILMSHARGVICLAARRARVPVVNLPAKRIKQSVTGNGNASKVQVQCAVREFFSLERTPHPADVADALAAALCYASSLRSIERIQSIFRSPRGSAAGAPRLYAGLK